MEQIFHVYPIDDLKEHLLETLQNEADKVIIEGEIRNRVSCKCSCQPRLEYEVHSVIVVHSSFDGRECIEETNEILGGQNDSSKQWSVN